jgi:hypothetical protein
MVGLSFFALGGAVATASYILTRAGIGPSVVFLLVAPAMVTVGLAMMIAPTAPATGDYDFGEWLESLPTARRVAFYAIGALGLALGVLLIFHLGGWTFDGVLELIG